MTSWRPLILVTAMAALIASSVLVGCRSSDDGNEQAAVDGLGPDQQGSDSGQLGSGQGGDRVVVEVEGSAVEFERPVVEIPTEWPSEIDALYGRYWLYWEAFAAAYGPPAADPTYAPLRELSTSTNWADLESSLQSFATDGLVLELPEESITEHQLRLPNAAVLTPTDGAEVILQDCWIDDFIQRTVDGEVVSVAREAKLMNVVMRAVDGQWRVHGVSLATPESDGYDLCAALTPEAETP